MAKNHSILKLIAGTTLGLFAFNKYVDYKSSNKHKLTQTGSYYPYEFGNIYYKSYGKGKPLLLIHDQNIMSSSYEWSKLKKYLEANHKVYVMDLLGTGQSAKPRITYTNYMYIEILHKFINEVIQEPASIVTSHNAGSIGIMLNHMYHEDVENVILINPNDLQHINFETTKLDKLYKEIMYLPLIGTAIYNLKFNENNIRRVLRETYFEKAENAEKYFDLYYETAHHNESKNRFFYASEHCKYTNIKMNHAINDKDNLYIISSKNRPEQKRIVNNYIDINKQIQNFSIKGSKLYPQIETPESLGTMILNICK